MYIVQNLNKNRLNGPYKDEAEQQLGLIICSAECIQKNNRLNGPYYKVETEQQVGWIFVCCAECTEEQQVEWNLL